MDKPRGDGSFRLADLARPEVWADPYPLYRALHEGSMQRAEGEALVFRHAEVNDALRDARLSSARGARILGPLPDEDRNDLDLLARCIGSQLPFCDPPLHTTVRRAMHRVFTPRAVEQMRPRLEAVVNELLDDVGTAGGGDFIADVAYPLPAIVIAEMMGIPPEDRALFKQWSIELVLLVGGQACDIEQARRTQGALHELLAYLDDLAAERRRKPGDDLFSGLLAVSETDPELGREELYFNYFFLLTAGHETATNLLGNGLLTLLREPTLFELLRGSPELLEGTVDEMLRYESPVQITARVAPTGKSVVLMLGAANRDPDVFPDPDHFDARRPSNRHVAFGSGAHFCLGAALARLEAQVLFSTLGTRFAEVTSTATPEWAPTIDFRGLTRLPITVA